MALGPEVDGNWKLSSGSPSAGLALSSGGNDEAKSDESDGEYERDDNDPVALETEGNHKFARFGRDRCFAVRFRCSLLVGFPTAFDALRRTNGASLSITTAFCRSTT